MRCIEAANGTFDFRLLNLILSAIASSARRNRDRVLDDERDLGAIKLARKEFGKTIGSLSALEPRARLTRFIQTPQGSRGISGPGSSFD